ncbi:MAG TPA: DNA topoisomerase VI [Planctomycetaceae bacterium]|nr:MAG: DNA topoisomerase IV subunit A [Phycisphaeraceae bacterium]HAO72265.1 DNA topoisomerase VI [Planctomycetaceae bacterium]HAU48245.1 DNA topoisomerase VI [Planctomycetaceae bacterium]|tara:strand:- start:4503 stop:5657 length:1155 start_codon:yes stop_codon:yes gene_type:complete
MAKKVMKRSSSRSAGATIALPPVDRKTRKLIVGLANEVEKAAERRRDPHLDIPTRSLSNVRFNKSRKIIEMGGQKNRRHLFNLSQAKSYMQTLLVATGCKSLIDQQKTTSIRGLYYLLKHTIEGTREETFGTQDECDPIIEDLEVTLESLREQLHVYASNRGGMVGPITLIDSGDEIDCSRMGSGGYSIPSIVEEEVIRFKKCTAKFILHVEKDTVWRRFNEDKFWRKHNCLLTHGGGQPPRGVRRMLYRLHHELKLPVYCLLDNDPWGYYIYSVLKQGSINLAYESKRMAIPSARFLGLRSIDYEKCKLAPSVQIALSDSDIKRAKQIAAYPWFAAKKAWQKEIQKMLSNGFKLEVESLISKDISYVTEVYTPERLADHDWLD